MLSDESTFYLQCQLCIFVYYCGFSDKVLDVSKIMNEVATVHVNYNCYSCTPDFEN